MTASAYVLTKSSTKCNWPSFQLGIFIPILYMSKYVNKHPIDHNIVNISNYKHRITISASTIRLENKEGKINKKITPSKYPKSNEVLFTYPQALKLKP